VVRKSYRRLRSVGRNKAGTRDAAVNDETNKYSRSVRKVCNKEYQRWNLVENKCFVRSVLEFRF